MDSLPAELIDRISSFLDLDTLKRTLLVSRAFQASAEYHSGAFSEFVFAPFAKGTRKLLNRLAGKDKRDLVRTFLDTYSGHRFKYLRYVQVHTSFPSLKLLNEDPDEYPCRESLQDLAEKDESFTRQIERVFHALKYVESKQHAGRIELCIVTPVQWIDADFCRHRSSSAWRIHLLRTAQLPRLSCIRSLTVCNPGSTQGDHVKEDDLNGHDFRNSSRLDWRVLLDIASHCPNLEYLACQIGAHEEVLSPENVRQWHFERDYDACVSDTRTGFALAAQETRFPESLKNLQLDFLNNIDNHVAEQRGGGPDYTGRSQHDPFSTGLSTIIMNPRRVDLRVMVDESLFKSPPSVTSWPNLEFLNIVFHPRTPSGCWYFRGPSGEGGTDEGYSITEDMRPPLDDNNMEDIQWHEQIRNGTAPQDGGAYVPPFRNVPNDDEILPFLAAFAQAASNMPWLRIASIWSPIFDAAEAWGMAYARPNESFPIDTGSGVPNASFRQMWWSVGGWRPEKSLHVAFQGIGATVHSEELQEYWTPEEPHGGFLAAYIFEQSSAAFPVFYEPGPREQVVARWYSRAKM